MAGTRGAGTIPVASKVSEQEHGALRWMAYHQETTVSAIIARYIAEGLARENAIQGYEAARAAGAAR
jgi:hypothetical protein